MAEQELLKVWPDVGQVLQVGRSTAYNFVQSGAIPSVRITTSIVRVRREDLSSFIEHRVENGAK